MCLAKCVTIWNAKRKCSQRVHEASRSPIRNRLLGHSNRTAMTKRQTDKQRERERQRQTDRQTDRQRQRLYLIFAACRSVDGKGRRKDTHQKKIGQGYKKNNTLRRFDKRVLIGSEGGYICIFLHSKKVGSVKRRSVVFLVSLTCLLLVIIFSSSFAVEYIHTKER